MVLESLLQKLQEEGQFLGSGGFSVDRLRHSQSLFGLQLRAPFQYLLKLVQTAVVAGSGQVDFQWNSSRIQVEFEAPQLEAGVLIDLIEKGQESSTGWRGHLEMALLLLPLVESRNFELVLADTQESVSYTPRGLVRGPALDRPGLRLRVDRPTSHRWKFWESHKFEQRLRQNLENRLCFCSIQITANGRWLNPGLPEKEVPPDQPQPRSGWAAVLARPCAPQVPHAILQSPRFRCSNYLKFRVAAQAQPPLVWGERIPAARRSDWLSMVTLYENPEPARHEEQSRWGYPLLWHDVQRWLDERQACLLSYQHLSIEDSHKQYTNIEAIGGMGTYQAEGFPLCQLPCLANEEYHSLHCPPLAVDRIALLPWVPGGACRIIPLLDGVALEPIQVSQGLPGAAAIIAIPEGKTDLEQMRLVEDDRLEGPLSWAVSAWSQLLLELQDIISTPGHAVTCDIPPATLEGWQGYFEST